MEHCIPAHNNSPHDNVVTPMHWIPWERFSLGQSHWSKRIFVSLPWDKTLWAQQINLNQCQWYHWRNSTFTHEGGSGPGMGIRISWVLLLPPCFSLAWSTLSPGLPVTLFCPPSPHSTPFMSPTWLLKQHSSGIRSSMDLLLAVAQPCSLVESQLR